MPFSKKIAKYPFTHKCAAQNDFFLQYSHLNLFQADWQLFLHQYFKLFMSKRILKEPISESPLSSFSRKFLIDNYFYRGTLNFLWSALCLIKEFFQDTILFFSRYAEEFGLS